MTTSQPTVTSVWAEPTELGASQASVESPPEDDGSDKRFTLFQRVMRSVNKMATLSQALRISGAMTVVAAMSAFLLQDWSIGNDVNRFYLLIAQTMLLATGGFGLSFVLKENKGARAFFGLALLSITVNMTTLGALIFSTVPWNSGLAAYPTYATWTATSFGAIGLAAAAAALTLVPIAVFSYRIFARPASRSFALVFALTNGLLLVPARESLPVGVLALIGLLLPLWALPRLIVQHSALRTREGWFAVATLLVPSFIMIVRSLWLYQADDVLQCMLALIAFIGFRACALTLRENAAIRQLLNWASVVAAAGVAVPLASVVEIAISADVVVNISSLVFAGLVLELAHRGGRYRHTFALLAAAVVTVLQLLQVVNIGGSVHGLFALLSGAILVLAGKRWVYPPLVVMGLICAVAGVLLYGYRAFAWIDLTSWATLSILGATAIVLASVLERHGTTVTLKWKQWTNASAAHSEH